MSELKVENIDIIKHKNDWLVLLKINNVKRAFKVQYSTTKGKKYKVQEYVINNGEPELKKKTINYGDATREHYFDALGGYDELNHNDQERKDRFYKRFKK
jgi:hypothetical protein